MGFPECMATDAGNLYIEKITGFAVFYTLNFVYSTQHMLVEGLANLNDERARAMSLDWAARWTRSNFIGYQDSQVMYEKVSTNNIESTS